MFWPILILIPFTALALGAVHPWAFGLAEVVSFTLIAVWMAQVVSGRRPLAGRGGLTGYAVLALGLAGLVALQLLPLPPRVLQVLSPETYVLYSDGLPGWPSAPAYRWAASQSSPRGRYVLPTPQEVSQGAPVRGLATTRTAPAAPFVNAEAWMPLSVAAPMTRVALLKFLMYVGLGLLLMLYPFGREQETKLYKNVVRTVLATGLVISLVGLAEQVFPTGKPLWIFSPYDWKGGRMWGYRCFGTFANPDHFGDYLAMVWSFALSGMLFPNILGKVRDRIAVPILCGTVGLVVLAALLATASRGGWLAAIVGSTTILLLAARLPAETRPALLRQHSRAARAIVLGGALVAVLFIASLFTSNASRGTATDRLHDAMHRESVGDRFKVARQTIPMIRQFPIFGVGLGAWPEIYPKYAPPPWDGVFMNAVHDEYVQFIAETGLIGLLLGGGILLFAALRIESGIAGIGGDLFPIAAACTGALAAIAVHSIFDFPLRVPANALLAVICLALLLRMLPAKTRPGSDNPPAPASLREQAVPDGFWQRGLALVGLVVCLIALSAAVSQQRRPYPYDLRRPANVDEAVAQIMRYPTSAPLHVALAQLLPLPDSAGIRGAEVNAALALDPSNPSARDLYAADLMASGNEAAALRQITRSVFDAPTFNAHYYLRGRFLPWLTPAELDAAIAGLKRAAAAGYQPAVQTLTLIYDNFGRWSEEGDFLAQVAAGTDDAAMKSALLTQAGMAFVNAEERGKAREVLQQAIAADPRNADAYRNLAIGVYARAGKIDDARQVIQQGLAAGAPVAALYEALADVAIAHHDLPAAEEALQRAVAAQPYNFKLIRRLGEVYASDNKLDRAISWLRRASRINPAAAPVFFELAQAEENNYQFSAADRDYARAIALDGANTGYRATYADFKKRVADATPH
jgi:O-antigen ligase/tetratricopeptide (TPR) repeat protein